MQTRVIDAEQLRLVLVCLRMKAYSPTLARFAAMSDGAYSTRSCDWRSARSLVDHTPRAKPPVLLPLLPSVRPSLVQRTRLSYGLAEVKRTWGIGYKAMLAEVAPKLRTEG